MNARQRMLATITLMMLALLGAGFTLQTSNVPQAAYTVTLTDVDFPVKVPAEVRAAFAGKWDLQIAEGNKFTVSKDDQLVTEGKYTSTADRLVLTDEKGPLSCSQEQGQETGTYKWVGKDGNLTLKAIDDKCNGRRFILTLKAWSKKS
jgi:hypothetical protein